MYRTLNGVEGVNVAGAPTTLCPVFGLSVYVVMVCVVAKSHSCPSIGLAGSVSVNDAIVPAGL
jgi:hypothetical protein